MLNMEQFFSSQNLHQLKSDFDILYVKKVHLLGELILKVCLRNQINVFRCFFFNNFDV